MTPHRMHTERAIAWRAAQALGRLLTTLLFDLKVYGLENVPARGGWRMKSRWSSAAGRRIRAGSPG